MKMQPFRLDNEPVKDKNLAEDMARASNRFRTREAEKRKLGVEPKGFKKILEVLMTEVFSDLRYRARLEARRSAGQAGLDAESEEFKVEVEDYIKKETNGLSLEDLGIEAQEAQREMEKAKKELSEFESFLKISDQPAKEAGKKRWEELSRKRLLTHYIWEGLNSLIKSKESNAQLINPSV